MPTIDLHSKPFDEETLTKLAIFEAYTKAWLPTFIMSNYSSTLNIFDFFAGPGYDLNKTEGSPIRILKQVAEQRGNIFKRRKWIKIFLNEKDREKFDTLENSCNNFIDNDENLRNLKSCGRLKIFYSNADSEDVFSEWIDKIRQNPSLVFLDQNGIKFLADKYFQQLINCDQTDFLYYSSSSYFKRFGDTDEFKKTLLLNMDEVKNQENAEMHKYITKELQKKIPKNNNTKLYPFTLKKGVNVFGIIFGAKHPRAIDKFLDIVWKVNKVNGEANFDITHDEYYTKNPMLIDQPKTKIEKFQEALRKKILNGELKTNKEVYLFTLEEGHIPTHSVELLKKMKEDGEITYEARSPLINYKQVFQKNGKIITYQIIKK